jgi:hypothetical protein
MPERISAERRRLLVRGASAALLPLVGGGCTTAAIGAHERSRAGDDVALLQNALALERRILAAYAAVAGRALLAGDELELAKQFAADHQKHEEAIAASLTRRQALPAPEASGGEEHRLTVTGLASRTDALRFLLGFEEGLALAHLGAVPAFDDKDLAKGSAGIMGVESMHWSQLRRALGESPVPAAILG